MMGAIPRQIKCCDELSSGEFKLDDGDKAPAYKLWPIFGCELYVQNKHCSEEERKLLSPEEMKEQRKSYHLLAIAHNVTGYKNLIQLSTWGWLHGFYYKPRVTHEQLLKHKEGITFTSCCYIGEIGQAFDRGLATGSTEEAEEMLCKYMAMFGEHFYLELMLLDFNKQKPYDKWLIKMHDKYHIPLELANDVHYNMKEDSKYQRYMLMIQKKTTLADIEKKLLLGEDGQDIFELQDQNLWMKSEEEINMKWEEMYQDTIPLELFEQAKLNTVKICEKSKGVEINREPKLPQIPDDKNIFADALVRGMKWRGINNDVRYQRRLQEEFDLITRKGYASYFLIQQKFTDEARRKCKSSEFLGWGTGNEAVGPGRGCLAGDTRIILPNGKVKRLDEIQAGEEVIGRDGLPHLVEKTFSYEYNGPLVELTVYYGDIGCKLTPDHMVWCKKTTQLEWCRADEVEIGDWLFAPNIATQGKSLSSKKCVFRDVKDGLLLRVMDKNIVPSDGKVFDIAVPSDETFLTDSFIVHNSGTGSLCNYVLGITDVNPMRHGLLFSRFLSESRGGKTIKTRFTQPPLPIIEDSNA